MANKRLFSAVSIGDSDVSIGDLVANCARRAYELQIKKLTTPVTMFSQARSGTLTSSEHQGLIGDALLRHYKLIFDYASR